MEKREYLYGIEDETTIAVGLSRPLIALTTTSYYV